MITLIDLILLALSYHYRVEKLVVSVPNKSRLKCFYLTLLCLLIGSNFESKSGASNSKESYLGEPKTVEMKMQYKVSAPDKTYRAKFVLLIPETIPHRQKFINKEWILPQLKFIKEMGGLTPNGLDKPKEILI